MSSYPPITTRKRDKFWPWRSNHRDRLPPAGSSPTLSGLSSIAASPSTSRPATPQASQHHGSSSATQQPQHEDATNSNLWSDRGLASGGSGKLKSTLDAVITLMRRINPAMDGTPAKIPFAAILSVASVYEAIQKLDESGLETYNKLADRLNLLRQALIASDDVETQAKINSFLEFLHEYGLQLETARGKKTFSKITKTPEIQAILQELDRKLSDRTQLFHLDISLAQGREMKRGLDNLLNISTDVYNRIVSIS
ncbi:hypothetical protein BDV98DRAFT_276718 [Pterulicium gracile]|uniref:Uncharacterized protein n=1 Tax=Pterulicium gracile TaxID=1884261 RepID=A0A5C3Q4I6_9AGAR|nr:hypothetical protein BDV98DRAFT_276718 [Pterula gracilis]